MIVCLNKKISNYYQKKLILEIFFIDKNQFFFNLRFKIKNKLTCLTSKNFVTDNQIIILENFDYFKTLKIHISMICKIKIFSKISKS